MIWRVALERHERQTALVDLEADTADEARDLAVDRAKRHDVIWENDVTSIEVVGVQERDGK